jgi:hypothetical protein
MEPSEHSVTFQDVQHASWTPPRPPPSPPPPSPPPPSPPPPSPVWLRECASLSGFDGDAFSQFEVYDRVASQAASSLETSCVGALTRAHFPDGFDDPSFDYHAAAESCFAALSASVYVLRSDGALACLGAGIKATGGVDFGGSYGIAAGLYIGVDGDDDAGPFVQFECKQQRQMEFTAYGEDFVYKVALGARFLLLFTATPQLTTGEPSDEEEERYAPTFARGELQLVAEQESFYDGREGLQENLLKAMRTLRFVHA